LVLIESGRQDSNLRPSAPKALFKKIEHLAYRSILCFEELARAINWLEIQFVGHMLANIRSFILLKLLIFKKIKFWKMLNFKNKYFTEIK